MKGFRAEEQVEFIKLALKENERLGFVYAFSLAGALNRFAGTEPSVLVLRSCWNLAKLGANLYLDCVDEKNQFPMREDLSDITLLCHRDIALKTAEGLLLFARKRERKRRGKGMFMLPMVKVKKTEEKEQEDILLGSLKVNLIMPYDRLMDRRVLELTKSYGRVLLLEGVDAKEDFNGYGAYWLLKEKVENIAKGKVEEAKKLSKGLSEVKNLAIPILLAYLVFDELFKVKLDLSFALDVLRKHYENLLDLKDRINQTASFLKEYLQSNWEELMEEGEAFIIEGRPYVSAPHLLQFIQQQGWDKLTVITQMAEVGLITKGFERKRFVARKWINNRTLTLYELNLE